MNIAYKTAHPLTIERCRYSMHNGIAVDHVIEITPMGTRVFHGRVVEMSKLRDDDFMGGIFVVEIEVAEQEAA